MLRYIAIILSIFIVCLFAFGCTESEKEPISTPTAPHNENTTSNQTINNDSRTIDSENSSDASIAEEDSEESNDISEIKSTGILAAHAEPQTLKLPAHELTLVIINSESGTQFLYGRAYSVERKTESGWEIIPFVLGVEFYDDLRSAGEKAEIKVDLNDCDFEFAPGRYRIVFPIYDTYLYAEFTVE